MNVAINLTGRIGQLILQLIIIKLISLLLPKEDAAIVFMVLLITGAVSLFFVSPLGQFFNRHLIDFEKQRMVGLKLVSFFLYVALIAPLVFSFTFIYFEYQVILTSDIYTSFVGTSYFLAITFNQISIGSLLILGHSRKYVYYSLITQVTIIILILFSSLNGIGYSAWLVCLILSNIAVGYCAFISLFDGSEKFLANKNSRREWLTNCRLEFYQAWDFSKYLFMTILFIWIFQTFFRFELVSLIGAEKFVIFTVGYSLAAVVFSGSEQLINSYCLPIYYRRVEEKTANIAWIWLLRVYVPTYIVALIFVISLADLFVYLFLDSSYSGAASYLRLAALLEFIRVINNVCSLHSHGLRKPQILVRPAFHGSCIFIIFQPIVFYLSSELVLYISVLSSGIFCIIYLLYQYAAMYDLPVNDIIRFNRSIALIYFILIILGILINRFLANITFNGSVVVAICIYTLVTMMLWIYLTRNSLREIFKINKSEYAHDK